MAVPVIKSVMPTQALGEPAECLADGETAKTAEFVWHQAVKTHVPSIQTVPEHAHVMAPPAGVLKASIALMRQTVTAEPA